MRNIRPVHVLSTVAWLFFGYFAIQVMTDQLTLNLGKGLILTSFFVVGTLSSMLAYSGSKRQP